MSPLDPPDKPAPAPGPPLVEFRQVAKVYGQGVAAMRALDCATFASYSDGSHRISFDEVVKVMKQTGRDLPLDEMLFDRWERARSLGFGPGASIYHNSYVYGDVRVGAGTWVGPFTILDGSGGLGVGD